MTRWRHSSSSWRSIAGKQFPGNPKLRDGFGLNARGAVQVEGKGEMHTFLLTSARSGPALTNEAAA